MANNDERTKGFKDAFEKPVANHCSQSCCDSLALDQRSIVGDVRHAGLEEKTTNLCKPSSETDVTLVIHEKTFKAHKAVLVRSSAYMKRVLLQPNSGNIHHVTIPEVTPRAFNILLQFMYTRKLDITCQDLVEVYNAAAPLGMKDAAHKCWEMLNSEKSSIVNLYVTAKKIGLHEATSKAFKLILTSFSSLAATTEFLNLDVDQFTDVLSADIIGARSEIHLFVVALKWINANFLEREQYIERVISCIRFGLMELSEALSCFRPPILPAILNYQAVKDRICMGTCYAAAKHLQQHDSFKQWACKSRTYLYKSNQPLKWEYENVFNPLLYPGYKERKAATKIQAMYRAYKVRKELQQKYPKMPRRTVVEEWKRPYSAEKYRRAVVANEWKQGHQITNEMRLYADSTKMK